MSPASTASSLLERVKANDPAAWRRFVEIYGPLVYHWCRRQNLQTEDVADIFQEVFRSVASQIGNFRKDRPGDTFRGWLLTITLNKIRDHFRNESARPRARGGSDALRQLAKIQDPVRDSSEFEGSDQRGLLLRRVLNLIRGDFEEETWLAFWRAMVEGHYPADIARDLGITVNAVYKAKSRVLRRLRTELGELLD